MARRDNELYRGKRRRLNVLALALSALAMLAGSISSAVESALIRVASLALQEQLLALAAAQLAHSFCISCHS